MIQSSVLQMRLIFLFLLKHVLPEPSFPRWLYSEKDLPPFLQHKVINLRTCAKGRKSGQLLHSFLVQFADQSRDLCFFVDYSYGVPFVFIWDHTLTYSYSFFSAVFDVIAIVSILSYVRPKRAALQTGDLQRRECSYKASTIG